MPRFPIQYQLLFAKVKQFLLLIDSNLPINHLYNRIDRSSVSYLKYIIQLLLPHYILPLVYPNPQWSDSIAHNFALTTTRYALYQLVLNTIASNYTGVMDNSADIYILYDKDLFIRDIKPCPLSTNVGTVVEASKLEGISLTQIEWIDNSGQYYKILI